MYVFSKITFNTRKNSKKKNMAILVRKRFNYLRRNNKKNNVIIY